MSSHDEIRDQLDMQQMCPANPDATDGLRIEKVLRRAHEIHRERGGMIGYDADEWLQAWGESPEGRGRSRFELPN
jgi:hypothetical protein